MMKVAIISPGVLPLPAVRGGAVECLIDYLLKENNINCKMEITVFSIYDKCAISSSTNTEMCNYKYIKINRVFRMFKDLSIKVLNKIFNKKYINNSYINKVKKIIKKNSYNHIVIENRVDYVLPIKKVTNSLVSVHIHNDYLNQNSNRGNEISDKCYKIITVSEYIRKRVITLGNQYSNKVCVLKNCADIIAFDKKKYSDFKKIFRINNNISDDDVVIMFSGRIHATKGIKELLLAFKKVKTSNCKLLIAGSSWYGSNNKTEFANEIDYLSEDVKDKIVFTGFVQFSCMPSIYAAADICIVPSIWDDPAPLVVFEAMASGIPLIVTESGGIPEYVNNDCAIKIKRDENLISNLATAIDDLANSKEKRELMGISARNHALQFNTGKYYKDFISILCEENADKNI